MHHFTYNEFVDEAPAAMRERERQTMTRAIDMLRAAQDAGPNSREMVEALYFLRRLWGIFINDISSSENELTEDARSGLLSIGVWMNKEIDRVRSGQKADLMPLIEINEIVRDGLK